MKKDTIRGMLGLIIVVGVTACSSSNVSQTASTGPKVTAPMAAPLTSNSNMSCVPALFNRQTQTTESYDCAVLVTLKDGTQAKDLTRSVRMAAADVVNKGYLVASR